VGDQCTKKKSGKIQEEGGGKSLTAERKKAALRLSKRSKKVNGVEKREGLLLSREGES